MAISTSDLPFLEKKRKNYCIWTLWLMGWSFIAIVGVDVAISILRIALLTRYEIFLITSILATVELVFQFLFWRWFAKEIAGSNIVMESVTAGKTFWASSKEFGYTKAFKNHLTDKFNWALNGDHKVIRIIKKNNNFIIIFCLALVPLPGFRSTQALLYGSRSWILGFLALVLGNIARTAMAVLFWSSIIDKIKS